MASDGPGSRKFVVELRPAARRDLKKVPRNEVAAVVAAMESLALSPRPANAEQLAGKGVKLHRIRQGDYRIVYVIEDEASRVVVVALGNRAKVYSLLKGKRRKQK